MTRCHVIKLGPNNDEAAKEALAAWPQGLQVGGGISLENAQHWLSLGASKLIVTSYLFPGATFSKERLVQLCELVGKDRLVVDVRYENFLRKCTCYIHATKKMLIVVVKRITNGWLPWISGKR